MFATWTFILKWAKQGSILLFRKRNSLRAFFNFDVFLWQILSHFNDDKQSKKPQSLGFYSTDLFLTIFILRQIPSFNVKVDGAWTLLLSINSGLNLCSSRSEGPKQKKNTEFAELKIILAWSLIRWKENRYYGFPDNKGKC